MGRVRKLKLFLWADRLIGLPSTAGYWQRVKARSLVLWALGALPVAGLLAVQDTLLSGFDASVAVVFSSAVFMLGSVVWLVLTKQVTVAGWIFSASVTGALAIPPLIGAANAEIYLLLLTVSPLIFGFIVSWQASAGYTFFLAAYSVILFSVALFIPVGIELGMIAASGLAGTGCALAMSAYSHQAWVSAKKLARQRDTFSAWSTTDHLTGARNRRAFDLDINAYGADGCIADHSTIILLDVDRFKAINDEFGHDAGDSILRQAVERIKNVLPDDMQIYRIGGDEFAIYGHAIVDTQALESLAETILATFEESFVTRSGSIRVCCSLGVSHREGDAKRTIQDLYTQADLALFEAKKATDPSYCFASREISARSERRSSMAMRLRDALEAGRLNLVFQPQHCLKTQSLVGFEVLARWSDDVFGPVSPVEFVAVAQEFGLAEDFDRAVFDQALREAKPWLKPEFRLSINITAATACDGDFFQDAMMCLERYDVSPRQIELEITETDLIDNWHAAAATMGRFREAGVGVALDDFGTGYSSLSYLSKLQLTKLKIDRSFVIESGLAVNAEIIRCIVRMAKALDIECVSEGVEDAADVRRMMELGCEMFQGFFFSKPLDTQAAADYVQGFANRKNVILLESGLQRHKNGGHPLGLTALL